MRTKAHIRKNGLIRRGPDPPLPFFCDHTCPYAAFAPNDAVGACRREQAVYCTLLKKYNNKNARCIKTAVSSR